MQFRQFLCISLFVLYVAELIEARGGSGGGSRVSSRIGAIGGGSLFNGRSKSRKSIPKLSSTASFSSSSTGGGFSKHQNSISQRFSGYRPMITVRYFSFPSHFDRDEDNMDYRQRFKSLDNDVNAGFGSSYEATRMLSNLLLLVNGPQRNKDAQVNSQKSSIEQHPNDMQDEISSNISAWFELITTPNESFRRMNERAMKANRNMKLQAEKTKTESPAVLTVDNEEFKETTDLRNSNKDPDSFAEITTANSIEPQPLKMTSSKIDKICVYSMDVDSSDLGKVTQQRNCFPPLPLDSVEISIESSEKFEFSGDDENRGFKVSESDAKPMQQQTAVETVVNESLKPVLKIMKQKEPGNIFNVPDESF